MYIKFHLVILKKSSHRMHFINEIPQKTKNGNIKWLIKNSIHQNITFSGYSVIFFYTFINKTNCFVAFETLKKSFFSVKKKLSKNKRTTTL